VTDEALKRLLDALPLEGELAIEAATASDAARHYDRAMAHLLRCGRWEAVAPMLGRLYDATPVRRVAPPQDLVEGGYGRHFGAVTVADKARFWLLAVLGPERGAEAIAAGPSWAEGRVARWNIRDQRFEVR
jgi:hypothetical protein